MKAVLFAAILLAAPLPAAAQSMTPEKLALLPVSAPAVVEAYGLSPQQFGELRLPKGKGPFPVAVIIHGGCWLKGVGDARNIAALASDLSAKGFATWNIEYRVLGEGGGWPTTFQDWGAGADHLRALAKRYPLDLKRVITVGHSAGALGATWLAARPGLGAGSEIRGKDPIRIRATVSVDGPSEVAKFAGTRDRLVCGRPVIAEMMGGMPTEKPERYAEGDPGARLPLKARQLIVSSEVIPKDDAESYAARARGLGDRVELLDVTGAGHFDPIAPGTPAGDKVGAFIAEKALN